MSCCGRPITIHRGCELVLPFEFGDPGAPENTQAAGTWRLIAFHPRTLAQYFEVAGVATYVAPDPDEDEPGRGDVVVTIPPAATLGRTWQVATYALIVTKSGVDTTRVEGRLRHSLKPAVTS